MTAFKEIQVSGQSNLDGGVKVHGPSVLTGPVSPYIKKGDLAYSNTDTGIPTRLPVGSNGQVLTVASGLPSWAPAGGGSGSNVQIQYVWAGGFIGYNFNLGNSPKEIAPLSMDFPPLGALHLEAGDYLRLTGIVRWYATVPGDVVSFYWQDTDNVAGNATSPIYVSTPDNSNDTTDYLATTTVIGLFLISTGPGSARFRFFGNYWTGTGTVKPVAGDSFAERFVHPLNIIPV